MNILNNLKVLQPYNLERSDNKIRIIVITHTIDLYNKHFLDLIGILSTRMNVVFILHLHYSHSVFFNLLRVDTRQIMFIHPKNAMNLLLGKPNM